MYHNDEDDSFASSTMAAEGSQPEAMPASSTLQLAFASDEAARAQCLRCKTDSSNYGKHTCSKRRNTSPAVTAVKRTRPKRNSTDPSEAHVDRIWSPASTNVNEWLSVSEARKALLSPSAMPNIPAALIVCDAATLQRLEFKAASGEPEWSCGSCNASGWSQLRACICMDCGADSPVDAELMTELKHAMRQEMLAAPRGRKYLGGRKAVLGPRQLQSDPRAEGAYDVFGDDSDFGEVSPTCHRD